MTTTDTRPAQPPPTTDGLTGLANRLALEAFLAERTGVPPAGGTPLSLLAIEMSRFGSVTDSVGTELGDRILVMLAQRLRKVFPGAAAIARTHGDHFCLAFEGDVDLDEQVARLVDFAQRPLALRGEIIVLSVRLGVAVLGDGVESAGGLLHAAEVALHRAKREQLQRCDFRPDLGSEARARHQIENDLRVALVNRHAELHTALGNDEFQLLYQPIVDTTAGRVHALEALIRWHHPRRGVIAPARFIPLAEQIRVMDVLGRWTLRRACADAMTLPPHADGTPVGISVNVSPTQFGTPGVLLQTVREALHETGIAPGRVQLEITESAALGADARSLIQDLRALGCRIALDDFGTGYSSLTQLHAIPLDDLKLDRSFIADIGGPDREQDRRSDRLTRAALAIARSFDLTPIVEGVETAAQHERLRQHGARLMQGYFFSRPLPLAQAVAFIHDPAPADRGALDA